MAGSGPACQSHCHGSHRTHMHNRHTAHEGKGLPGPYPIAEEPSTCDIIKATQYGMPEQCKELVEAGYDV